VSAAASLTGAFTKIGDDFEAANPGAEVTFNFGPSSTLEAQIEQGAPADVFAPADPANMDELGTASKLAAAPAAFARNELVIVTKPGNPRNVHSLADLATVGTVSLCGSDVPCGKYAAQVLQGAGVAIPESSVTRGQDVKATLAAVTTGDADAGIVYVTDAKGAGDAVATIDIPDDQNAIAVYPIAVLAGTGEQEVASAFVDAVTSDAGRATLQSFGFLPPR
jgi:molybdate transport system substrate-binding protein